MIKRIVSLLAVFSILVSVVSIFLASRNVFAAAAPGCYAASADTAIPLKAISCKDAAMTEQAKTKCFVAAISFSTQPFEEKSCDSLSTEASVVNSCSGGSFLGFPTWHKYLKGETYNDLETAKSPCRPTLSGLSDVWKIVAAVIEVMLRIAGLAAIGFVIYGGALYLVSQGSPEKTKAALSTVVGAIIGLVIAIVSTALVSFIAGRF